MKVIIADDNKAFSEALSLFIETELHHEVLAVHSNGKELIANPSLTKAALILTDIEMPELNGIEATKKVKELAPNTFVIAITNHIEKIYRDNLAKFGFNGCIVKDNIYTTLENAIQTVVSGKFYFK